MWKCLLLLLLCSSLGAGERRNTRIRPNYLYQEETFETRPNRPIRRHNRIRERYGEPVTLLPVVEPITTRSPQNVGVRRKTTNKNNSAQPPLPKTITFYQQPALITFLPPLEALHAIAAGEIMPPVTYLAQIPIVAMEHENKTVTLMSPWSLNAMNLPGSLPAPNIGSFSEQLSNYEIDPSLGGIENLPNALHTDATTARPTLRTTVPTTTTTKPPTTASTTTQPQHIFQGNFSWFPFNAGYQSLVNARPLSWLFRGQDASSNNGRFNLN